MSLIEINDVIKRYDNKLTIDHLNLSIEEGEIFGLLGPNGAGKSTTIKMLSGLIKIDQGQILVDGIDVKKQPRLVKKSLGLVPQEIAIYENLTARENVTFFGKLYGLRRDLLVKHVDEALAFVGLSDRQKDRPSTFSGGMKRRLNIACAIVHQPKVLIMDEPTVGIDPQSRNHILECVKQLNKMGSTIIYTSHYMEEVAAISNRVGIIDKGRLIISGTQESLRKQVADEEKLVIQVSEIKDSAIEELKQHPSIKIVNIEDLSLEIYLQNSQIFLSDILFILSKHHLKIKSLKQVEPNLETLFLTLTGRTLRD
jgi:ABC-2 type transport system ATP-binding protein